MRALSITGKNTLSYLIFCLMKRNMECKDKGIAKTGSCRRCECISLFDRSRCCSWGLMAFQMTSTSILPALSEFASPGFSATGRVWMEPSKSVNDLLCFSVLYPSPWRPEESLQLRSGFYVPYHAAFFVGSPTLCCG